MISCSAWRDEWISTNDLAANERKCFIRVYLRSSAVIGFFGLWLHAQTIEIVPERVMLDEPASVHASGLQPNQRVTIRAELVDGDGERW